MQHHETEGLILRAWRPSDYAPFARLNADPVTMRYFPAPLSEAESNAMADKISALLTTQGWGLWAVEIPQTAPFIGFVGLHIPTGDLPFSPCTEIAWRLDRRYWGHGYASEAARFALKFAFNELSLDEVVAFTTLTNTLSQAVMSRIGMQRTNEIFEHPSLLPDSPLRPHILYRLTRQAWRNSA